MLYYQLHEFDLYTSHLTTADLHYDCFLFAILLMPINWLFESLRWKIILKSIFSVSWRQSIQSVLSGTALGFVTPARIGDYAGRIIIFPEEYRIPSLACLFFNSIIQNSVHVVGGLVFSYFFLQLYWPNYFSYTNSGFIIGSFVLVGVLGVFWLPNLGFYIIKKFSFFRNRKWSLHFKLLKNIPASVIAEVIIFSVLRYGIYFLQYLLILEALAVDVSWLELSSGIAFIYMLQSGIPLPPLLSFLGRAEIAVLVLGQFQINAATALLATLTLWIINLAIPALVGYFILLRKNLNGIK